MAATRGSAGGRRSNGNAAAAAAAAAPPPAGFFGRHRHVFVYVPNLIGYARIAFALYAFSVALRHPGRTVAFYLASFVCDELDGRAARAFGQASTFGAVLDMVTDRCATACLLALLCVLYPGAAAPLLGALMLDVFSHWMAMYASLAMGEVSHKAAASAPLVVRLYYRHRLFMGFCCVCVEALLLAAYCLAHCGGARTRWVCGPGVRLGPLVARGAPVPLAAAVAIAAAPGAAIKQYVNVVQLVAAAKRLVEYDQRKKR